VQSYGSRGLPLIGVYSVLCVILLLLLIIIYTFDSNPVLSPNPYPRTYNSFNFEMAEIPKLVRIGLLLLCSISFICNCSVLLVLHCVSQDLSSSCSEALNSEEKNRGSAILSSDHVNAFQYSGEKGDSFVIDMDAFSSANHKDPTSANSRITVSLFSQTQLNLHLFLIVFSTLTEHSYLQNRGVLFLVRIYNK